MKQLKLPKVRLAPRLSPAGGGFVMFAPDVVGQVSHAPERRVALNLTLVVKAEPKPAPVVQARRKKSSKRGRMKL